MTARERLERIINRNTCCWLDDGKRPCIQGSVSCDYCANRWDAEAVVRELDESDRAWRKTGETYRLVADVIEVPA